MEYIEINSRIICKKKYYLKSYNLDNILKNH